MGMTALGLDIGSRSIEAVWIEGSAESADSAGECKCAPVTIAHVEIADSGHDPIAVARELVAARPHDVMSATGYGRRAAHDAFECDVITEIKAYGVGVHETFPQARSVLDIGGQDTKVIALAEDGRVLDFEMNDKCAAGTGKFLEVMAKALGYSLDEFSEAAQSAQTTVAISSMCTVFAESEVTGLVHRGEDRPAIARGLLESIAKRTMTSLRRIGAVEPLVFAGGVAKNRALVSLIAENFSGEVLIPQDPQIIGALGAAITARDNALTSTTPITKE